MALASRKDEIKELARRRLGFENLRPGQEEAISAVVAGRDTLAVMPTGAGKSAIYEISGALRDGPTVVVSPLIALQRDQVDALDQARIGVGAQLNSAMTAHQRAEALAGLAAGEVDFLLLAPEQLANAETLAALSGAGPGLFVVDEAHCVSAWGHDFRPDYLHLAGAVDALGRPPVLALTATAAPPVREEIVSQLGMEDPVVVVRGFDRPNIHLAVETFHDGEAKQRAALEHLAALDGPGIVYVATRRETVELAEELTAAGRRAAAYHGGLAAGRRDEVHEAFMGGDLDIVVATTAFGMGIDKPDVRFVVHFEISDSIDSYYQEIGRAGRDGEPARALLLYRAEDLGIRRFFASGGEVGAGVLTAVAEALLDAGDGLSAEDAATATGHGEREAARALDRMSETGWARYDVDGRYRATDPRSGAGAAAEEAAAAQVANRNLQRSRVEMMRSYAESRACRRSLILGYFGEPYHPPCGSCDNCDAGRVPTGSSSRAGAFAVGAEVTHSEWGPGEVMRIEEGEKITVLFGQVGYRTLSVALVEENGLLRVNE